MKQAAGSRQQAAKPGRAARAPRWVFRAGFLAACCLLPAACLSGCMGLSTSRNPTPPADGKLIDVMPTSAELVGYLNRRAEMVNSLATTEVDLDIKADGQTFSVHGDLHCQKPRNFRLRAKKPVLRDVAADFGSNDSEFWYYISEDRPPDLYHCAYTDLSRGTVRLPFPLHPDWVLEALGLGAPAPVGKPEEEEARGRRLEVKKTADNKFLDLYEHTRSLQGQPILKVTRLNNFEARGSRPQVVGYYLYEAGGQRPVCQATVAKVQYDAASGTVIPQVIEISWPAMKLSITMTLDKVRVNSGNLASNPRLFARPTYSGVREVDLARGAPLMTPTGVQRAGAFR
ncbi:MAG TPA: hypothetical protein VGF55_28615 [Gemmataceae bacterium]|jgi:hypothetical protein